MKKLERKGRLQIIDFLTSEKDVLISTLEAMKNGKEQSIMITSSSVTGIMNEDFSETSKNIQVCFETS